MSDRHVSEKAADEVLDELARVYGDIPPEASDGVDMMRARWKTFGGSPKEDNHDG